jgi:hypothetical protein
MTVTNTNLQLGIVAFEKEHQQLILLLKSVKRFAPQFLKKISIVTQESGSNYLDKLSRELHDLFDGVDVSIKLSSQDQIIGPGYSPKFSGWKLQQILKLKLSTDYSTDFTLVLDTKNHLIADITAKDFFDEGKILYTRYSERHQLEKIMGTHLRATFKALNANLEPYLDNSLGPLTPFVFVNKIVRDMMNDLERDFKNSFPDIFLEQDFAEFYLYGAYLSKHNLFSEHYKERANKGFSITFFGSQFIDVDNNPFKWGMERIQAGECKIFGLHWSAFNKLNPQHREALINLWIRLGLLNYDQSKDYLEIRR